MQLSSIELSSLLEEIAAMVASRRPIAVGMNDLSDDSMGRIGVAAKQLSEQLESGASAADAVAAVSGRCAPLARVVMQCVSRTGSTEAIYHLATVLRQRHERETRAAAAMIYPVVTCLISYVVSSVGLSMLLIEVSQSELVDLSVPMWLVSAAERVQQYFWIPIIIAALFWIGSRLICRFQDPVTIQILPGAKKTEELTNWASFCELLAIAIDSGFPFDQATEIASNASDDDRWRDRMRPLVEAVRNGATRWNHDSLSLPPLLGWRISRLADGSDITPTSDELRHLAQWYDLRSQQRWRFWSEWFPMLSTIFLMTLLILAICFLVIRPIYDLS